ncbi:hypothetical protein [Brevibacillus centrosporus]|uniref:hypothetical protein n=1 Tax=Brevibacillus centrosporus TaxID=54910 RepID=UPI002E2096F5|nr:hypothetical protein [Brevibacillus centrosporus]
MGVQKPHDCSSCGKKVNNYNDPDREEKLKVYIEQRRIRKEAQERKKAEERARIEAKLEAGLIEEEGEHGANGEEG